MQGPEYLIELFHGYTYSGHPLAVAAGVATLELYKKEGLFERARSLEGKFADAMMSLKGLPNVADIRPIGLMCGIDLDPIPGSARQARLHGDREDVPRARHILPRRHGHIGHVATTDRHRSADRRDHRQDRQDHQVRRLTRKTRQRSKTGGRPRAWPTPFFFLIQAATDEFFVTNTLENQSASIAEHTFSPDSRSNANQRPQGAVLHDNVNARTIIDAEIDDQ